MMSVILLLNFVVNALMIMLLIKNMSKWADGKWTTFPIGWKV